MTGRAARWIGWFAAAAMLSATALVFTAPWSGASPGARGFVCTPGAARGINCAGVSMSLTHEPSRVEIGRGFKATMAVHNFGPSSATGVHAIDNLPSSMTFVSVTAPGGVSCTAPPVGMTGTVDCTLGSVVQNGTLTVVVVTRPTNSGLQNNQAHVTSTSQDSNSGNNPDNDPIDVQTNGRGCTIIGTTGVDDITGTDGADVICGLAGADHINGGAGADVLYGEGGSDTLTDHSGTDTLLGGPGNDTLDSADSTAGDTVNGNKGTNTCTVDAGDSSSHC
jgi:uncharacterized repeat protein (TIGR01451 family)